MVRHSSAFPAAARQPCPPLIRQVDYWLGPYFPSPPSSEILQLTATETSTVEILAALDYAGTVVIMIANHAVRSSADNNGPGDPRTVLVDVSALGSFTSATLLTIDARTDLTTGPSAQSITPAPHVELTLDGYGVSFLALNP